MNCTASVHAPAEGAIHSTSVRVEGGCQSATPPAAPLPPPTGRGKGESGGGTFYQLPAELAFVRDGVVVHDAEAEGGALADGDRGQQPSGAPLPDPLPIGRGEGVFAIREGGEAGCVRRACAWPKMDDALAPAADPHAAIRRGLNAIDRVLRKSVAM